MKKITRILSVLALSLALVLSLAACDMLPEGVRDALDGLLGGECAHEEVEWVVDKEANCRFDGSQHSVCVSCGETVTSNVKVPRDPEAHTPSGEWQVSVEPSCLREGERTQKCTLCSKTVASEVIPKSETHDWVYGRCRICSAPQLESVGLEYISAGDGTCEVVGIGSCTDSSLVIPAVSPAGDRVVSIAEGAFEGIESIVSLIVADSVTSVGDRAFEGCRISSATVPAAITASVRCDYLSSLTVTGPGAIPDYAMNGAPGLVSVTMLEGVSAVGVGSFSSCPNLRSIVMPDSLVTLGQSCFAKCEQLLEINIGKGVERIENQAFQGCKFVTDVYIPASVRFIGFNAINSPRLESAVLEVTEGWYSSSTAIALSGTSIAASVMSDPLGAAKAISVTYTNTYIQR